MIILAATALLAPRGARGEAPPIARWAREVAVTAGTGGRPVALDPSLEKAAAHHGREVLADERAARRERLSSALEREGLADALVLPFTATGRDPEALAQLLSVFARDTARPRGPTHAGVALSAEGGRFVLTALFARRLVELAPLPRRSAGSSFVVLGRAHEADALEAVLFAPCLRPNPRCDGEVRALPIVREGRALRITVPFDRGAGPYVLELLATRDRGPEVTSLWRFTHGASAPDENPSRALPPVRVGLDAPSPVERTRALIGWERDRRELAPLLRSSALDRAAAEHASAVCAVMIAAHRLPGGPDPRARAAAAGHRGPVAENVAIAEDVDRAHLNLLDSPSHRRSMLDPTARTLGVGVAASRGESGEVCVVQLFGSELP